ncbi:MAG TPA: efflux RND transporter periplasmic adaptor subunit [Ignavibacteriales bacterium]|nr:efflux RND transporter periplasmic adaptor subunit [Ignavibacteriales bacterium]
MENRYRKIEVLSINNGINIMKIRILISILSLMVFFTGCTKKDERTDKPKPKAPLVKILELKPQKIESTIQFPGSFDAKVVSNIMAPIDGAIDNFTLRENDNVKKNQKIALINSQDRISLIANAASKVDLTKMKISSLKEGDSEYQNAKVELNKALEELKYSEKLLLPVPVIAPISGIVLKKSIEQGSLVTAKQQLLTIADFKTLVIKTSVNDQLYSKLRPGQKIKVTIDAYPEQEFSGVISLINPQTDPATRTIPLEIKVNSQGKKLQPGMMALLTFVTDSKQNALVVPNDAILTKPNGEKYVFVIDGSIAHQRIIHTGITTKDFTEVVSGISSGQRLVTLGQEMLKDNMKVVVQKPMPSKVKGEK